MDLIDLLAVYFDSKHRPSFKSRKILKRTNLFRNGRSGILRKKYLFD